MKVLMKGVQAGYGYNEHERSETAEGTLTFSDEDGEASILVPCDSDVCCVSVPVKSLLQWLQENRPDLFAVNTAVNRDSSKDHRYEIDFGRDAWVEIDHGDEGALIEFADRAQSAQSVAHYFSVEELKNLIRLLWRP